MSIMNHSNYRDFLKCRQNRWKSKHAVMLFRKTWWVALRLPWTWRK